MQASGLVSLSMDATTDRKSRLSPSQSAQVISLRMARENATGEIHSIDDKRTVSLDARQTGIESGAFIINPKLESLTGMKRTTKDNKRANWLALYERKLNEARPETIGKVDWDTAIFFYNQNLTAGDAVARYVANHPAIFGA